ncbi:MAG: murein L,D-transpeptidase catalytic domain family protein [Gammaproteobacteria bacterium]
MPRFSCACLLYLILQSFVSVCLAADTESPGIPEGLLKPLLTQYQQHRYTLDNDRYVALINYRQPSSEPRFYLIDMVTEEVIGRYRVAHGRGSDPAHTGYAEFFSDRAGSKMSSVGFFRTGETYMSETPGHGLSLRLEGISESNRNAADRLIVIHANHYMEPAFIDRYGMPGRSHGCLVFSDADRNEIIEKLQSGALIYAVR